MASIVFHRVWEPFEFVYDPGAVIRSNTETYGGSRAARLRQAGWLAGFYSLNLLLYTAPLTLAGEGQEQVGQAPPPVFEAIAGAAVPDPSAAWVFLQALVSNSAFLLAASVLVFGTFHLGVLLTLSTRGLLQSMHTVAYSTGVYMAVIFTLTVTVNNAEGLDAARQLLLAVQAEFFYVFIDMLGVSLTLPVGRPDEITFAGLSTLGKLVLAGEVVSVGYFLYSMYLGARLNHRASRFESLVAVAFVGLSPALYAVGTIVYSLVVAGGV